MKLKPWQENERRWLSVLVETWGGQVERLAKHTGWSKPTVRVKLLQYDVWLPKRRARLKIKS